MKSSKFLIAILSIAIFAAAGFGQGAPTPEAGVVTESTPTSKPAGIIRIGVVTPKLQIGADTSSSEAAQSVRETLAGYLKGPTVDVVAIEAKSPTNAAVEAGQKECDFILYTAVSKKSKTSLFGGLIKAAVPVVAGQFPGPATVSQTGSGLDEAKQAAADGGKEFVNRAVAARFGARDEVMFDFSVVAVADAKSVVAKGSSTAKAKTDGEDVISALVEQVGEKVLQAVIKK
jgi:hypothetical protein